MWTQGLQGFGSEAYTDRRETALATDDRARNSTLQPQTSYSLDAPPRDLPPQGHGTGTLQMSEVKRWQLQTRPALAFV